VVLREVIPPKHSPQTLHCANWHWGRQFQLWCHRMGTISRRSGCPRR